MFQQGQRPGHVRNIFQNHLYETLLEFQAGEVGWFDDDLAKVMVVECPDQCLLTGYERSELRICRTANIEVSAQGEHDDARAPGVGGRVQHGADERGALRLIGTQREQLFELIDDQK